MANAQLKKSDLISAVAEKSGADKKTVGNVLDTLGEVVLEQLKSGNAVPLPGLGKFDVRDRAARTVRNPSTGEPIQKPADRTVRIVVAKILKDTIK